MRLVALSFLCFLFSFSLLDAQTWIQKQDLPGAERFGAVSFTVNAKAYIVLGDDGTGLLDELWEYDATSDTWTQKTSFSGNARRVPVAFSIGSFGYAGLGWTGSTAYTDFYRYDPQSDSWTAISNYPGLGGRNSFGTATQGKGYVGGGASGTGASTLADDFWEYNPQTDNWTSLGTLPFGPRTAATSFSIQGQVFVTCGRGGFEDYNDLWAYDPATGNWTQKASLPGPARLQASSFVLNGKAIVGGGFELGVGAELSDYYLYDPQTDTWSPVNSFSAGARSIAVGFSIGQSGYLATGQDGNDDKLKDLWEFNLPVGLTESSTSQMQLEFYPLPTSGVLNFRVKGEHNHMELRIFNIYGSLRGEYALPASENQISLDLKNQASGIYFYQLTHEAKTLSGKISVKE